jgi:hypothetical protein
MEIKVVGVMTLPRYCLTLTRNHIDRAFNALGVSIRIKQGVFYGQCMQDLLLNCIDDDVDYAVTIDFDSLFGSKHVKRLLEVCVANPHIDALASLQARRSMPYPLFTCYGQEAVQFEGAPLKVSTAHFGLTAIKIDSLKKCELPLFHGQPGPDGNYDEHRIDDDIWFWKQWAKAGNSVYVDSGCSIGHAEEMIAYYDKDGKHQFTYPNEFITEFVDGD